MIEKFFDLVKENWLKPRSAIVALGLLGSVYVALISNIDNWQAVTLDKNAYLIFALCFFVIWAIYVAMCLYHNRLPRAPKDILAVLFVIDAESKLLFEAAKYKLVDNFNSLSRDNSGQISFKAFYINRAKVAKLDLKDHEAALGLLKKTNCDFLVSVRYTADDVSNAETFELRINNYSVKDTQIDKIAQMMLSQDMAALKVPVGKQKFKKEQTIDVFNFTTQSLVFACQYILGFVYFLSGETIRARKVLMNVRKSIFAEPANTPGLNTIKYLVDDRLFVTLAKIAVDHMQCFKKSKNIQHLYDMRSALEEANQIREDTYFYNLNMAYAHIILDGNISFSKACIEKCKKSQYKGNEWLYSDAFLSAYSGHAPGTILSKYKKAFATPYNNLVELVEYIEFVLEREPKRVCLHLAAALVYEEIGDSKLTRQHLSLFKINTLDMPRRIEDIINTKLTKAICNVDCDKNCSNCSRDDVA